MSRKFEEYITQEAAEEGLRNGLYVSGVLRVNQKKPSDGFCVTGKSDILIKGKYDRNRAFNADTIVVEIFPEAQWQRTTPEDEDEVMGTRVAGLGVTVPDVDKSEILLSAGVLAKLAGLSPAAAPVVNSASLSAIEPPPGVMKTGRVVYVANAIWEQRVYACSLQPNRMADDALGPMVTTEDKLIKAVPIDKRIPWILIQLNDVVRKLLNLPGKLDPNILFPIQVQKWQVTGALPLGRIKGVAYGRVGEPEVEAKVCIAEAGLQAHEEDFSPAVYAEVEAMVANFHAELEAEARRRIDLRSKRIFTIDPATARDLDDAIHIDIINEEFVEIGVHIADVGHYVKEGSQTDEIAKERCTSVYLCHRMYPMLPEGLCNALCSLSANEPKLTFTTWFRIRRSTGEVIMDAKDPNGPRFAKTVISSCCRFSYEEVQDVLDHVTIPLTKRPTVFGAHNSWELLEKDIFLLYDVCKKVRDLRFDHGSVRIDKAKMRFKLNENDVPIAYEYESHSASHWMIEELMLLANEVVAMKICDLGDSAVLRRHPPPEPKSFGELSERIRSRLGLPEWDGATSKALFASLQLAKSRLGFKIGQLLEFLVMKTMRPAVYGTFRTDDPHHYALSFDFYTHFTSPIRRYPDILVHRQLQTVLELGACGIDPKADSSVAPTEAEITAIEAQCNKCNAMKKSSRDAQEGCDVSFFCIYLRNRMEVNITTGTVMSITEKCFNVYIPKLGKDSPVFYNLTSKVPEWYLAGDPKRAELEKILKGPDSIVYVNPNEVTVNWSATDKRRVSVFDFVNVVIVPLESVPISYALVLLPPTHPKFANTPEEVSAVHLDSPAEHA